MVEFVFVNLRVSEETFDYVNTDPPSDAYRYVQTEEIQIEKSGWKSAKFNSIPICGFVEFKLVFKIAFVVYYFLIRYL